MIHSRTTLKNINHSNWLVFLGIFVSFADCNFHSCTMDGPLGNNVYWFPGKHFIPLRRKVRAKMKWSEVHFSKCWDNNQTQFLKDFLWSCCHLASLFLSLKYNPLLQGDCGVEARWRMKDELVLRGTGVARMKGREAHPWRKDVAL